MGLITTPNERTVTLKLKRIEVCRLITACNAAMDCNGTFDEKTYGIWEDLHDKLREQLINFDVKTSLERIDK